MVDDYMQYKDMQVVLFIAYRRRSRQGIVMIIF